MTITQSIVLGIIQGLTEFLPVSSSGHLIFLPEFFGWVDQGLSFDVVVHLGSLFAVVFYFRKKLWQIVRSFFERGVDSKLNRRLGLLLILTIIPAGLVGFFGSEWIGNTLRSSSVVAFGLIFWGLVLLGADYLNKFWMKKKENLSDLNNLNWKQITFVACSQAIALIPGTSRSGITMTAGLFAKFDKKTAAEFSFLMSVPIIVLAGFLKIFELFQTGLDTRSLTPLVFGFLAAMISGFFAISILMKIIQKWSFKPFAIYRIIVGILILILL